jgi:hypothetical protein
MSSNWREPADSRVGQSKLLAYLDGKAKRWCVSELEADYGMRDPGRTPIIDRDVDADDLRDTHRARLPMRDIVGFAAVVAVAHVMKRYLVTFNVSPCFLSHVRLPVAIIGRRKRQPPGKHTTEKESTAAILRQHRLTNANAIANPIARIPAATLFALPNGASNHTAPNDHAIATIAAKRISTLPIQRIPCTRRFIMDIRTHARSKKDARKKEEPNDKSR